MITLSVQHSFDNDLFRRNDLCYKGGNLTSIDDMDIWFFSGNVFEDNHIHRPTKLDDKTYHLNEYMRVLRPTITVATSDEESGKCERFGCIKKEANYNALADIPEGVDYDGNGCEFLIEFTLPSGESGKKTGPINTLTAHLMIDSEGSYTIRFYHRSNNRRARESLLNGSFIMEIKYVDSATPKE